jgi:hypothetical protein
VLGNIARKREHRIIVRPEPFGFGADVVVEPPFQGAGNFDLGRPSIQAAQAYAETLSQRLGLSVIDLTQERTR